MNIDCGACVRCKHWNVKDNSYSALCSIIKKVTEGDESCSDFKLLKEWHNRFEKYSNIININHSENTYKEELSFKEVTLKLAKYKKADLIYVLVNFYGDAVMNANENKNYNDLLATVNGYLRGIDK